MSDAQTYILDSDYGLRDIVIVHPYRVKIEATCNEIIRNFEYQDDIYFQNELLQLAHAAILAEDYLRLDTILALNYWNTDLVQLIIDKADKARLSGDNEMARQCLSIASYGNTNFQCRALNILILNKDKTLFDYVLSKINPSNISNTAFNAAFKLDVEQNNDYYFCKQLIKKDPVRFYMKKVSLDSIPAIRTPEEIKEYLKRLAAKYEIMAIQKFSTEKNITRCLLTEMPYDVTRYMVASYI